MVCSAQSATVRTLCMAATGGYTVLAAVAAPFLYSKAHVPTAWHQLPEGVG